MEYIKLSVSAYCNDLGRHLRVYDIALHAGSIWMKFDRWVAGQERVSDPVEFLLESLHRLRRAALKLAFVSGISQIVLVISSSPIFTNLCGTCFVLSKSSARKPAKQPSLLNMPFNCFYTFYSFSCWVIWNIFTMVSSCQSIKNTFTWRHLSCANHRRILLRSDYVTVITTETRKFFLQLVLIARQLAYITVLSHLALLCSSLSVMRSVLNLLYR